jgi:hypothetical protein
MRIIKNDLGMACRLVAGHRDWAIPYSRVKSAVRGWNMLSNRVRDDRVLRRARVPRLA